MLTARATVDNGRCACNVVVGSLADINTSKDGLVETVVEAGTNTAASCRASACLGAEIEAARLWLQGATGWCRLRSAATPRCTACKYCSHI